ncbi:MAG: sulfide/dihydroorotate dehydrogenase-like FAD/NAD-binding protein, partial [Candidatus Omnitrophica bacterium]|nr:sulfide/dihydroorotate dehydrogenase-like FAD/NAD-binding protein [Candidatus Omnitrophota bacterium]
MFKIVHKQIIAQDIKRIDIAAPAMAAKILPGQFVMLTPMPQNHAMPLAVVDADDRKGVVSFIVHEIGPSSAAFGAMPIGRSVAGIVGPLGRPSAIDKYGLVICAATGIGAAQVL